ncbi:MAG: hypothetical protein AMK71_05435 [Nitrospira bacterium SG8_35_4]|nr:MAG: hypothetical protein AMK71_05435 [Nitrospira bacterium SG8_35_4]
MLLHTRITDKTAIIDSSESTFLIFIFLSFFYPLKWQTGKIFNSFMNEKVKLLRVMPETGVDVYEDEFFRHSLKKPCNSRG